MMKGAVVLGLATGASLAEDVEQGAAIAVLEACLAETAAPDCVGVAANVCAAAEERQAGLGVCYGLESSYWEGRTAVALSALTGPGEVAEAFAERVNWPIPRPTLDAVQVTFEAYRDAACEMEGALWGNGSGAGAAWIACRMRVNAEHALRLEAWLESVE